MSYSQNLDVLIALISHLGLCNQKSRTPTFIAKDLGIEVSKIQDSLEGFSGIFRRSKNKSKSGESYYTLQIRFALRGSQYSDETEGKEGTALEIDHIISLMNFVSDQAQKEQDADLALKGLKESSKRLEQDFLVAQKQINQGRLAAFLALAASIIATISSLASSIF